MKKIIYVAAAALMMCACAKEGSDFSGAESITGKAPTFEFDGPMTKTNLVFNGTGLSFFWAANDKVAVFGSVGQNQQIPLTIQDVSGQQVKNASFTISRDFLLRKGSEYVAYCPVTDESIFLTAKKVPFSYTGQVQETNSVESTSHLGAVDYMVSTPTTPTDDNVAEFTFAHKCCPVLIEVANVPAGTYTTAALKASEENFSLDGTMNIFDGTLDTETYSDNIAVTLKGGFTVAEGGTLDAWIMAAPAELAGLDLSVVLTPSTGDPLVFPVPAEKVKNFVAGKAYKFSVQYAEELKAIDLGLTSGTLWANMNVGALTSHSSGNYYAWAETFTKESYIDDTYSFYEGGKSTKCTKYNSSDEIFVLEPEDDAATQIMGDEWKIPSRSQWKELIEECTWSKTVIKDYAVLKVTSKKNNNYIYLPMAGYRQSSQQQMNSAAYYWTDERGNNTTQAYSFNATAATETPKVQQTARTRYWGLTVRAVKK